MFHSLPSFVTLWRDIHPCVLLSTFPQDLWLEFVTSVYYRSTISFPSNVSYDSAWQVLNLRDLYFPLPGLECVDAFIARSCASISLRSCKLGGGGEDREVWLSSSFSCLLPRRNLSVFITMCYESSSFLKCIGPHSLVISRTNDLSVLYHYVWTWTHELICMHFHIEIEHLVAD